MARTNTHTTRAANRYTSHVSRTVARDFLDTNMEVIRAGGQIPTDVVNTLFAVPTPNFAGLSATEIIKANNRTRAAMAKVQSRLNPLLSKRGLYVSVDYVAAEYNLKSMDEVSTKVRSFNKTGRKRIARGGDLATGVISYGGLFSHISDEELNELV
jgi:hypothetical protein